MIYEFARHMLLRMPVKNPSIYLASPQSFLDDDQFRAATILASPASYLILKRQSFQADPVPSLCNLNIPKVYADCWTEIGTGIYQE